VPIFQYFQSSVFTVATVCNCMKHMLQVKTATAGHDNIETSPVQQKAASHTRPGLGDTTPSSSSSLLRTNHHPPFMLQCLSPRRSSSVRVCYLSMVYL